MLIKKNNGDTIVEVLFAISIFSLVAVGALSIMNKGTSISQNAIEATMVRHQIDAQAEALRFLNSSYLASYNKGNNYDSDSLAERWRAFSSSLTASGVSSFGTCPNYGSGSIGDNKYAVDITNVKIYKLVSSNFASPSTYAKVDNPNPSAIPSQFKSYGIWIEAIKSSNSSQVNQNDIGYIDFYIYACWGAIGESTPATDGTIVRLYEPR